MADRRPGNVTVRTDPGGTQKPDKERSIERIDAIVVLILAASRSMPGTPGIYDDGRGLPIV